MKMTTAQMIDITGVKTLYAHLDNDPEINSIMQVPNRDEKTLAEFGQAMMDDNLDLAKSLVESGKVKKILSLRDIPETNAVYCLYLPPFYLFTDLKEKYE